MSAAVLGLTALLLRLSCGFTGPSLSPPGHAPSPLSPALCPHPLDCARLGRHFCGSGASRCGPCLQPLREDSRGRCVLHRTRTHHVTQATPTHRGRSSVLELDEQIDFMSEQRSKVTLSAPPSQTSPAPTEMATNHSSLAPPTAVTNHSSALLSAITKPHPLSADSVFIVMSSVFIVTGSIALMIAGACWVRLQRGARVSQKVDYGPMRPHTFNNLPGDRRLVQSAQMFHYQHQRQQMLFVHKLRESPKVPDSGASTDDENDEGDFTVYECPGLAPSGEMEVKNPLFDDAALYFHKFHK